MLGVWFEVNTSGGEIQDDWFLMSSSWLFSSLQVFYTRGFWYFLFLLSFTANKPSCLVLPWAGLWLDFPSLPNGYEACSCYSFCLYYSLLCIVVSKEGKYRILHLCPPTCIYTIAEYFGHCSIVSLILRNGL